MLANITPLILTYNEAPNIERTIEQLTWAKRIVVIDSYSTDETLNILGSYPQVEILQRKFDSFASQCNYGLEKISTEWVLSLDADYVVTNELIDELKFLKQETGINSYSVRFKYCVFGKPLRATLLPPRKVLYRRDKAIYKDDGHAHRVGVEGDSGMLSGYIHHDDRKPLSRWLWNQDRYMVLEVKKLLEAPNNELSTGDRIRKQKVIAPFIILFYCLILKGGILDGWHGWYYAFQRCLAEVLLSIRLIETEKHFAMYLDKYTIGNYTHGAPYWKQLLWYFLGSPVVESRVLPMSGLKVLMLRWFGAQIGQGVRIKPGVSVKFPWRLTVGDYVWIGEEAWIDNLAHVTIESHVCISQGVYLCTGNHDWNDPSFQLKIAPIHIQESSWIAAKSVIGPGVTIGRGAVLTLGGVAGKSLEPMTIYAGNPAQPIKERKL